MRARLIFVVLLAAGMAAQTAPPPTASRAPATYRIAGTVVSSLTNQPLAGIVVVITPTSNRRSSQMMKTAADGRFAFADLAEAKYSLTTASAPGYRPQGFNQHGNFFTGIAVGPGLDAEGLIFRLVPDASIEGTITDDDGEPVRNANVQLYQRNNDTGQQRTQQMSNAISDDRGHFQFGHLEPGTYFVGVSARPWYAQYLGPGEVTPDPNNAARVDEERAQLDVAYPLTFYPGTEDSASATPIPLHPGERVNADVTLRAVPAVHLRIKAGGGNEKNSSDTLPRGFPRVSQRIFEGYLTPVMAAQGFGYAAGAYEYTGIVPGHYVVEMPDAGERRANAGWYKEIDLSGTVELNANESPPLVSLTGAVVLEGPPDPAGRIYVVLTNRNSSESFTAEVSDKGLFDFKDSEIRPGTYDVQMGNGSGFQLKSMVAKGARTVGRTIEVSAGSAQLVCTTTRAVSRVTGVVMRDGKPFAGAMVVLVPRDPNSNLTLFRRDQSDSDGTFTLPQVLPGPYTVIAIENGWELDWASPAVLQPYLKKGTPLEVAAEGKTSVTVDLQ